MKNTKIMKALSVLLIAIFSLAFVPAQLQAQEKEKEVKIKIVKEKDGERVVIDTTYTITVDESLVDLEELSEILKAEGLDEFDMDFDFTGDENMKVKVIKMDEDDMGEKVVIVRHTDDESGDLEKEMEYIISGSDDVTGAHDHHINVSTGGHAVFVTEDGKVHKAGSGEGKHNVFVYEVDDDGAEDMFFGDDEIVWAGDNSRKIEVVEGEDGKKVIVENEDGTKTEYLLEDGKGTYFIGEDGEMKKMDDDVDWVDEQAGMKHVRVSVDGDKETIIISDNGETIELEDIDKGANAFFFSSDAGEGDQEVFVEVIKKQEGDKTVVIKNKIILKSLDEDDFATLEKSGVEWNDKDADKLEVDKLAFHPNPSDGKFTLEFTTPKQGTTELAIYDINGKQVYNERITNFKGHYKKEIDISAEEKGTYFLRINQGKKVSTRKIILK